MKLDFQAFTQEGINLCFPVFKLLFAPMKDYEIIDIAQIVFYPQLMLHEIIKLREIDIGKELAGEVAKRHPLARNFRLVVFKYGADEPHKIFIVYPPAQDGNENSLVNIFKIMPDIGFQRKADNGIGKRLSLSLSGLFFHFQ